MRTLSLIFITALVAVLGACSASSDGSDGPSSDKPAETRAHQAVTRDQLVGAWGAEPKSSVRGVPWFRFQANGKFGGFDGCNSVGGKWTFDPATNAVRVPSFGTTAVACPSADIASFTSMTFDGKQITYTLGDGRKQTLQSR